MVENEFTSWVIPLLIACMDEDRNMLLRTKKWILSDESVRGDRAFSILQTCGLLLLLPHHWTALTLTLSGQKMTHERVHMEVS